MRDSRRHGLPVRGLDTSLCGKPKDVGFGATNNPCRNGTAQRSQPIETHLRYFSLVSAA